MRTTACVVLLVALEDCAPASGSWDICGANETGVNTNSPQGDDCRNNPSVFWECAGVVCRRTDSRCGSPVDGAVTTDQFRETFETSAIPHRNYSVAGGTTFQVDARLETAIGPSDSVWVDVFFGNTRKCTLQLGHGPEGCAVQAPRADQETTVFLDSATTTPQSWFTASVSVTARYVKASHRYSCSCGSTC